MASEVIKNRYEFVYLFDVENGNPNGDPDAGNMPRIDPETNHGIVTDVCLKRKVRNYIHLKKTNESPFRIYVQEKAVLNDLHNEAHKATGAAEQGEKDKEKGKRKGSADEVDKARLWMCNNFYDVRTFGAVMSTGVNCGQVQGPVQFNFGKSIESVVPLEVSITRMAVATQEEANKQQGDNRTMGRKHILPYGLYRSEGYISANYANKTGFSEDDLSLLWESLENMFEHDHSAARGKMCARKLVIFKHKDIMGNAPAHKLFDLVKITPDHGEAPARKYSDYRVEIRGKAPEGVELIEKF